MIAQSFRTCREGPDLDKSRKVCRLLSFSPARAGLSLIFLRSFDHLSWRGSACARLKIISHQNTKQKLRTYGGNDVLREASKMTLGLVAFLLPNEVTFVPGRGLLITIS